VSLQICDSASVTVSANFLLTRSFVVSDVSAVSAKLKDSLQLNSLAGFGASTHFDETLFVGSKCSAATQHLLRSMKLIESSVFVGSWLAGGSDSVRRSERFSFSGSLTVSRIFGSSNECDSSSEFADSEPLRLSDSPIHSRRLIISERLFVSVGFGGSTTVKQSAVLQPSSALGVSAAICVSSGLSGRDRLQLTGPAESEILFAASSILGDSRIIRDSSGAIESAVSFGVSAVGGSGSVAESESFEGSVRSESVHLHLSGGLAFTASLIVSSTFTFAAPAPTEGSSAIVSGGSALAIVGFSLARLVVIGAILLFFILKRRSQEPEEIEVETLTEEAVDTTTLDEDDLSRDGR
jgi:hypothetical protein